MDERREAAAAHHQARIVAMPRECSKSWRRWRRSELLRVADSIFFAAFCLQRFATKVRKRHDERQ
jgi:hypothetical protein